MEISAPEPENTPPRADGSTAVKSGPLSPPCEWPKNISLVLSKRMSACVDEIARRHRHVALGEQARALHLVDGALPAVGARRRPGC